MKASDKSIPYRNKSMTAHFSSEQLKTTSNDLIKLQTDKKKNEFRRVLIACLGRGSFFGEQELFLNNG